MHDLLQRQLRELCLDAGALPPELKRLLAEVEGTYRAHDAEREELAHSLELSSQDLSSVTNDVAASEGLFRGTLESTTDGILAVGNNSRVLHYNNRFLELMEIDGSIFDRSDVQRRIGVMAARMSDPQAYINKTNELRQTMDETFDVLTLKSGRVIERYSRPLVAHEGISGRVWSFRDVTERHTLEEQLRHQAFHDPLTDLSNRAHFVDRVQLALDRASRSGAPVFVLFMDIDNFKAINDSLGHTLGDETLRAIAGRLRSSLRPGDTAARLGGDEFALLIEGLPGIDAARTFAQRLLKTIRTPLQFHGQELVLDASIGIVEAAHPSSPEELLRNADIAMYEAKGRGKGQAQVYVHGMHSNVRERQQLTTDLRRALERKELYVLYQPTMCLEERMPAGAEALIRWQHPIRGTIAPDDFIPIAEESGFISAIGRFVLLEACKLLARWQAEPLTRGWQMNVNVSARQLRDSDFVASVRRMIRDTGIEPGGLVLEITETAMIEDPERTFITLTDLKRLGVRLALDDFGTGYSSLSFLKRFPIDVLKIDKSFISDLYLSERETLLTSATIAFGKQLDLKVFAEGIETEEQFQHLRDLRCEYGQGYLFSRPVTEAELEEYLRGYRQDTVAA